MDQCEKRNNFREVHISKFWGAKYSKFRSVVLMTFVFPSSFHWVEFFAAYYIFPVYTIVHMLQIFLRANIGIVCFQVAHEYVVSQIISYIYNGFLLPVVLPSLLQVSSFRSRYWYQLKKLSCVDQERLFRFLWFRGPKYEYEALSDCKRRLSSVIYSFPCMSMVRMQSFFIVCIITWV